MKVKKNQVVKKLCYIKMERILENKENIGERGRSNKNYSEKKVKE
jgi:hypothetical protein